MDLRERVVSAVATGGLARQQAAARVGVAPSSAIKWVARYRTTRSRGPAKMGRLKAVAPLGSWKTMPFIAALRRDRIDAPCLFDGPINGEVFLVGVQTFLVPTLRPGDIVVLDNLGSHRGKRVRQAIRQAGAKLL